MNQGRFAHRAIARRKQRRQKVFVIALCVVLLLSIIGGTTLAAMMAATDTKQNTFIAGSVSCSVGEDYRVENTGNVDAYIRAAIVVNWENTNGDIRGIAPVAGTDYKLTLGTGWEQEGLYYYYNGSVEADAFTGAVCTVEPLTAAPDGYTLAVEVLAEAIQAEGDTDVGNIDAVVDAWQIAMGG